MATLGYFKTSLGYSIPVVTTTIPFSSWNSTGIRNTVIYSGNEVLADFYYAVEPFLSEARAICRMASVASSLVGTITGKAYILKSDGTNSEKWIQHTITGTLSDNTNGLVTTRAKGGMSLGKSYISSSPKISMNPFPADNNVALIDGGTFMSGSVLVRDPNNNLFFMWAELWCLSYSGLPAYTRYNITKLSDEWSTSGDIDPIKPKESDFMNRFQPRVHSKGVGVYLFNKAQLNIIIDDLWTTTLWETFQTAIFGNGSECLLGLKYFYGISDDVVSQVSPKNAYVTIGNVALKGLDSIKVAASDREFLEHSFGSIKVPAYYGDHRDYTQTTYKMLLPFIGVIDLDPDSIINKTITLKYRINISDGDAICMLTTPADSGGDNTVFLGVCTWGYDIPLKASGTKGYANWAFDVITKHNVSASTGANYSVGSLSPNANAMGDFVPKLFIYRKDDLTEGDMNSMKGRPSNNTSVLSSHSGYVEVAEVTNAGTLPTRRNQEIVDLLKGGVYI